MKVPKCRLAPAALIAVGVLGLALLLPTAGQAARAPATAFNPSSYDYGTVDAGTTASKTFTLTNSGGSATAALTVSLTGASAFSKTADTCTATSLGPNKSCSVTVQYAPTTDGASDSATLTASSKKPTAIATASLSGASTAAMSQSQRDCESFGGTFATGTGSTLWTCNDWSWTGPGEDDVLVKFSTLADDCFADGGVLTVSDSYDDFTADTTCFRENPF